MHVREMVSMLLVVALSMIVRLPDRHDYCICMYRLKSRGIFHDSGKGAISPFRAQETGPFHPASQSTRRAPEEGQELKGREASKRLSPLVPRPSPLLW